MKKWDIKVTLSVDESWIEDGFNASNKDRLEQIEELLTQMLPHAYGHEFKIKATVINEPDKRVIKQLQGE